MTKPVNIYALSRIEDKGLFQKVFWHTSQNRGKLLKDKNIEDDITALRLLVDEFIKRKLSVADMDGFFFSFKIPQIGKEFDLLKLTDDICLNIELKHRKANQNTENEQIKQIKNNLFYLRHLSKQLLLYSVNTVKGSDEITCYKYSQEDNKCCEVGFDQICDEVKKLSGAKYCDEIDNLFKPSEYLVPLLNNPRKFIYGRYFLTNNQNEIKKKILKNIEKSEKSNKPLDKFFYLTGEPGTGKTLLLYDLAKEFSKKGRTLIVHCAQGCPGHGKTEKNISNLKIYLPKDLTDCLLDDHNYILVDEAHRIYGEQFNQICESACKLGHVCILSSDPGQSMSTCETIDKYIQKWVPEDNHFKLAGSVRTNKELFSFINRVKDLNFQGEKKEELMDYSCVELNKVNSQEEAKLMLEYYKSKDYIFINYTEGHNGNTPYFEYKKLADHDTHSVIGQEFDKVVMLMGDTFYYLDEKGELQGTKHLTPHYLYPQLFYQGATRARERLAIIVVGNPDLFDKMISIVQPTYIHKGRKCPNCGQDFSLEMFR